MKTIERVARFLMMALLLSANAGAQNAGFTGNESSGVQKRVGDASPAGGLSTGETNSRVDDYLFQDEQINVDPDTGVLRVLRTNQKVLVNDYVTATFPLLRAPPPELRDVFRTVCGIEGGQAELILDDENRRSYIQVVCPRFMVDYLSEAVRKLDVEWLAQARDGSVTGSYATQYRPASSIDAIASRYAGEGVSRLDEVLNSIVRRDEPFRLMLYLDACALFDQPPPQAHLQFRIYEVDTSNDLRLGNDWIAWKNGPGRGLIELLFGGQESHHQFDNASGHFDPNVGAVTLLSNGSSDFHAEATQYLTSINYVLTSAFLDFLRVKGKARLLAQPEIFAVSGTTASWDSVDQVLAFDAQPDDTGAFGESPTRLNGVSVIADPVNPADELPQDDASDFAVHNRFLNHRVRSEVGITLNVRPVVGMVSSEVEIELVSSDVAGTTPQGMPILTHRRLVTKLRLVDGQPAVLGGLTREENVDSRGGAPWLSDIPVLGYLFGQETRTSRRKELLITVVPHFFQGSPDGVGSAEMRDTMQMVLGDRDVPMPPRNCFGFDKWLFDRVEHP